MTKTTRPYDGYKGKISALAGLLKVLDRQFMQGHYKGSRKYDERCEDYYRLILQFAHFRNVQFKGNKGQKCNKAFRAAQAIQDTCYKEFVEFSKHIDKFDTQEGLVAYFKQAYPKSSVTSESNPSPKTTLPCTDAQLTLLESNP